MSDSMVADGLTRVIKTSRPDITSQLPPDLDAIFMKVPAHEMLQEGWAPVRYDNGVVEIATVSYPDSNLHSKVLKWLPGHTFSFHLMPHIEFQEFLLDSRKAEIADWMANYFHHNFSDYSAKSGFEKWQIAAAAFALTCTVGLFIVSPQMLMLVLALIFLLHTVVNTVIASASLLPEPWFHAKKRVVDVIDPDSSETLPFYTVMIPAYQETAIMPDLVEAMSRLQYPTDRLEILFLIEEHDRPTKEAALAAGLAPHMRIIDLPPGAPQTKPRSCNLGLLLARGELVVIFDAEDRPDPDQLLKSAAAFSSSMGSKLACVQARLFFYNAKQNFLTHQFSLEYALRYGMVLPGLARLGLPIPLGGTSNHFRTDILRKVGGWDAWNVTEDADLGMRCRALGYEVGMIDSVTWEEATFKAGAWVRQRTRWLKGFMITVAVHTKRPFKTLQVFRLSGMVTLMGIVAAGPATYLAQPLATAIWVLDSLGVLWFSSNGEVYAGIASLLLLIASSLTIIFTLIAALRRKMSFAHLACALPGYWALYWIAAWRALFQLVHSPFLWEKTPHGSQQAAPRKRVL